MEKDNLDLFELMLEDETDGVFANSFVEAPAMGRDFVYFGKEMHFQAISDEKHLVAGPLLIPNKKILRLDGEGKPYEVFFTPETIEKVARKFMKDSNSHKVTVEHSDKVGGVYLTENWIIEQSTKDKSNLYNFTLPAGTWFGIYKVENDDVWNKVKDGTFRGYSIEGMFEHRKSELKLALEKEITELSDLEASMVLDKLKHILKQDNRYRKGQRIDALELEGEQPSIASTYAGQFGPGKKKKNYIHPALIGTKK